MEADFEWPLDLIPARMSYFLRWNTSETRSPFTGQRQVLKRQGERWVAEMEFEAWCDDTGRLDALLAQLEGQIKTVALPDFRRMGPSGDLSLHTDWANSQSWPQHYSDGSLYTDGTGYVVTGRAVEVVSGGPVGDTQIEVDGFEPGKTPFKIGDYLSLGGHRHMLTKVTAADANGVVTVDFVPPLKVGVPAGGSLSWTAVTTAMSLVSPEDPENETHPPVVSTYRLRFEEAI